MRQSAILGGNLSSTVEIVLGSEGAGGAGVGEVPGVTGYISYVFALLCTEFRNDKSGYVIFH